MRVLKKLIRNKILTIRESMNTNEVKQKSRLIYERLISTEGYYKSINIFTYLNFKNEVETNYIIDNGIESNKKIYIPLCNTVIKELIICKMDNWESLTLSNFGILEPKPDSIRIGNRKLIDLVIVPGIVFDRKGNRVGYGAGYYDKFFSSLKNDVMKIGICYSFQLADSIIPSLYDIPMDYIITEKEFINCKM